MRIRTTPSRRSRYDMPWRARAVAVLLAAAGLYALAAAGPAAAQGTYYTNLIAAVPDLASKLVKDDRVAGKKVLVNAHDFFEEGEDGRNLPLSATLRERFRRELSKRGVQVFALPEGSEDEMVLLHGRWRELSEPGDRPGPRTIELTVYLVERTAAGQQLLPAAGGRVDAVEEALLTPDLASWGRHVVKELERRVGGRGRRVVHVGNLYFDGVVEPERLRRYLVRRWLRPAFSQSRLFRLASAAGEGSGGALHMDVFVHEEDVEVVLDIEAQGVQVATADFRMARGLIPARYLDGKTKPGPDVEPVADVETLLRECAGHAHGERWRQAWGCYREVLERDAGNRDAERGRDEIEQGFGERMQVALGRREFPQAREVVAELAALAPDSARVRARVGEWKAEIAGAERKAEARRIAELAPEMVDIKAGCFQVESMGECVEAFSMGKHEVTFAEYDRFAAATGRERPDDKGWGRGRRPVINVSWDDAMEYARWLSEETGRRYRLPTEAEWEYAARAGTKTAYPWGNSVGRNRANCAGCGSQWDNKWTAPVGSFEANGWGLHDTMGNVWEWTCSEYDSGYGGAERRCASGSDGRRVIRGGGWGSPPEGVRSVYRGRNVPAYRYGYVGFRLAQD